MLFPTPPFTAMTDLPASIGHLTDPRQLVTLVACTCLIVILGVVHATKKSSSLTPAHRFRVLLAAAVGAFGISLGAGVIVFTGAAHVQAAPAQQGRESSTPSTSSAIVRTAARPNTVLTEHRVIIPEPTSTPSEALAQRRAPPRATNDHPSFDCAKAVLPDELTICADLALRRADGALGRIYQAALATLAPAPRLLLVKAQKAWIVDRRQRCATDTRCFFDAIQLRAEQLE